jgi:serine/threonine-protein kinase
VLIKKLAEGGMADVLLARDLGASLPRLCVIKRLRADLRSQAEFVSMFLDEIDLAMRIAHPNIVRAIDQGRGHDGAFLVLEYLAGFDLDLVIERVRTNKTSIPWELAVRIISAASEGMAYAHALQGVDGQPLNLVHRDLTPSNIFLTFDGLVKVLDFGIARAAERRTRTSTGLLKGKARYLAPELIESAPGDGRIDQFSLGAALFEALTLRPLFHGANELAVIHSILETQRPSLHQLRPDIPRELDAIFQKMTARKPDDRFASMREVVAALSTLVSEGAWRAQLSAFVRQHFAGDFQTHVSLMERLATMSTEELQRSFGRTDELPLLLGEGADLETAVLASGERSPRASPPQPITVPLESNDSTAPMPQLNQGLAAVNPSSEVTEATVPAAPVTAAAPRFPSLSFENAPEPNRSGLRRLKAMAAAVFVLGAGTVLLVMRPKAPPPLKGGLLVRSQPPGASIRVDGQLLQFRTPAAVSGLSEGAHHLLLEHPDALPTSTTVEVQAGRQKSVEVLLRPK